MSPDSIQPERAKERLREFIPLPCDRPRPPVPAYLRETVEVWFAPAETEPLRQLVDVDPRDRPAFLLACLQILLFRYSGQPNIVVGAPVGFEMFGSPPQIQPGLLPVRTIFTSEGMSASDCIRATRESWAQAALDRGTEPQGSEPAVNVAFLGSPDWTLNPLHADADDPEVRELAAQCDLVIELGGGEDGWLCRAEYDAELFEAETVARLLEHYRRVLLNAALDPGIHVEAIPLVTDAERGGLLAAYGRPERSYPPGPTLVSLFESMARQVPEVTALSCQGRGLTYRQVNAYANRVARALMGSGVGLGARVGIYMDRTAVLVIGLIGILKAGAAYVPLDPAYPRERCEFMISDAGAEIVLARQARDAEGGLGSARLMAVEPLMDPPLTEEDEANPGVAVGSDALAYVLFTSGSTGKPKAVCVTHYNVVRLFEATDHWFGFNRDDVWTLFHSCSFDFSVWEIWGALLYGGRLVVIPFEISRSPEAFLRLLVEERVTVLNQTPSAFRQLLHAELSSETPSAFSLRFVIFGGEALEMNSLRGWYDRFGDERPQLVNMYGITETTVHVTYRPLRRADLGSRSVIGTPIPDLYVLLLDRAGDVVPVGVMGELHVGGAGVSEGYLGRPELTAERFIPDPFHPEPGSKLYRTGDLGRRLANGEIEYVGRIDSQVKIRGFRIELGEIEAVLNQHAGVRESVVVMREDGRADRKMLVAYVVLADPSGSERELRDQLKHQLPGHMLPAAIVTLDRLPLTNNGKVDRARLPAPTRPGIPETPMRQQGVPETQLERALLEAWEKVLGAGGIGVDDNFFDAGGDSLLMVRLHEEIRRVMETELALTALYQFPTVRALAGHLAGNAGADRRTQRILERARRIRNAR